ncbi:ATP-binding protein [Ancylothrix sp. C2]|uniref:sensor histidine kinase n=1 Tax=Ancylothrix sp. D3o TaxID=2953691 RepID=UPI0021BBA572|nr:ATP-binding protein [Ancylothrix sp. D3o]MCT7953110.1 ATP-binding protein [Ancylothrix sp. D3o]
MINFRDFSGWKKIFFGVRIRIVIWYGFLIVCSFGISILAVRQVLSVRLEERAKMAIVQEVKEFRKFMAYQNYPSSKVRVVFDNFLARNIPADGEFMLTFVNGNFYKCSPSAMPTSLQESPEKIKLWSTLQEIKKGELIAPTERLRYWAEPVKMGEEKGVFVVIQSTAGDAQKLNDTTLVILQVTVGVLVVSSVLTWWAAGRVLKPLRVLKETAHSISETNVSRRIAVRGSDDLAELTMTFNEMLDRLESALISQRSFINDAGHELRTPITIIRGHLELFGDDPEEQKETIALVLDELDRMSRLVNDLLLLAKAERPDFLRLEPLEMAGFIEELFAKIRALGERNWQLEVRGNGVIRADRQRLTQAIMNLAQNAVDHTNVGDKIVLGLKEINGEFCLWVRDSGEGIAEADKERIFERFARASNTRRRSEGYGLGLAIVRAIVEAHGGKVEVESQMGKGSIFRVRLEGFAKGSLK